MAGGDDGGGGRLLMAGGDDGSPAAAAAAARAARRSARTISLVFNMRLWWVSESVDESAGLFLGFIGQVW